MEDENFDLEVWINEMWFIGLDEWGGVVVIVRIDVQLVDFGLIVVVGNISIIGFGVLDQKVQEWAWEWLMGYDFVVNFNLDKFLLDSWGFQLLFYVQLFNIMSILEFDFYDLDILLEDKIRDVDNWIECDFIWVVVQEVIMIKSVNLMNVCKEWVNNSKVVMLWDIFNFSVFYFYMEFEFWDLIIEFNEEEWYMGFIDYVFSRWINYIEFFKGIQGNVFKIILEFNFNLLFNVFSFSLIMNWVFEMMSYCFMDVVLEYWIFYNKRFIWDWDYDLQWDLMRVLKFNFNVINSVVIDEFNEFFLVEIFGFE